MLFLATLAWIAIQAQHVSTQDPFHTRKWKFGYWSIHARTRLNVGIQILTDPSQQKFLCLKITPNWEDDVEAEGCRATSASTKVSAGNK
jgi:hypothetical protein